MDLRNPVVTVVEGPGDPVQEREWWEGLDTRWVGGDTEIFIGEVDFQLKEAP